MRMLQKHSMALTRSFRHVGNKNFAPALTRSKGGMLVDNDRLRATDLEPSMIQNQRIPAYRRFSTTRIALTKTTTTTKCLTIVPGKLSDRGGAVVWNHDRTSELHLPPADPPVGKMLYRKSIWDRSSGRVQTSMHIGTDETNGKADGVVGDTVSVEEAHQHARSSGLRLLATLLDLQESSDLEYQQVLHLRGLVKASPDFYGHASVIDGCSQVLLEAFGPEKGVGTRECFGVSSLGATVACTVEMKVAPK